MQELNEHISEITKELEHTLEDIKESDDFKTSRNRLIFIREKVVALVFEDGKKRELLDTINSGFQIINDKIEEYRESFTAVSEENYNEIKPRIDEILNECKQPHNFKGCRERLVSIQSELRQLSIKKDIKEALLTEIQQAFITLRDKQDEEQERYEMECSENYFRLKAIVDRAINFAKIAKKFSEARKGLIDAQKQIKGQILKRDKRDELYGSIRESFNELNERQDKEREEFEKVSMENYTQIKVVVDNAIEFAKSSEIYKDAREALISAQKEIKKLQLKRSQRDELYGSIRVIFNTINEKQNTEREVFDEESNKNYTELLTKVDKASQDAEIEPDFRIIRENLIALQDEVKILKLRREQRNDLFKKIRVAFGIFDDRRKEYNDVLKVEKRDKLQEILDSLQIKLDKVNEILEFDKVKLTDLQSEPSEESKEVLEKRIEENQAIKQDLITRITDIKSEIESL